MAKLLIFISLFLGFLLSVDFAWGAKKLVMKLVAEVDREPLSSRDAELHYIVTKIIEGQVPKLPMTFDSDDFRLASDQLVVETVIFKEAVDFGIAKVSDSEVDEVFKSTRAKIMEKANVKSHWVNLEISDAMLKEKIQRKLRAGKLLKYKTDTDQHEATEEEVKDYFEKNRQRFGSASLDSFKVTIKKFLTKKTADDRLREWFDVLKKKYKVKSL